VAAQVTLLATYFLFVGAASALASMSVFVSWGERFVETPELAWR
jgi:hypothetical protein